MSVEFNSNAQTLRVTDEIEQIGFRMFTEKIWSSERLKEIYASCKKMLTEQQEEKQNQMLLRSQQDEKYEKDENLFREIIATLEKNVPSIKDEKESVSDVQGDKVADQAPQGQ